MRNDLLIVEDLMLLLLDDDGASIRGAGTLHYTLGGAVLSELALLGRVEADPESRTAFNGPKVSAVGDQGLDDPLLQEAFDMVRAKPGRAQTLILKIGANLQQVLLTRLEQRGLISREARRTLGVFRTTKWPATDAEHETELRQHILSVLEDGAEPEPRTAAVIALLYASGAMPALNPPLPWNKTTVKRAQAIQAGEWGAEVVSSAVLQTTAAITAASAAAVATSAAHRS